MNTSCTLNACNTYPKLKAESKDLVLIQFINTSIFSWFLMVRSSIPDQNYLIFHNAFLPIMQSMQRQSIYSRCQALYQEEVGKQWSKQTHAGITSPVDIYIRIMGVLTNFHFHPSFGLITDQYTTKPGFLEKGKICCIFRIFQITNVNLCIFL